MLPLVPSKHLFVLFKVEHNINQCQFHDSQLIPKSWDLFQIFYTSKCGPLGFLVGGDPQGASSAPRRDASSWASNRLGSSLGTTGKRQFFVWNQKMIGPEPETNIPKKHMELWWNLKLRVVGHFFQVMSGRWPCTGLCAADVSQHRKLDFPGQWCYCAQCGVAVLSEWTQLQYLSVQWEGWLICTRINKITLKI